MARLLAALFVLLSSVLVAQSSVAMAPALMAMSAQTGDPMDMTDCGHAEAPSCRIDCVMCHAIIAEPPPIKVTSTAYVLFDGDAGPTRDGVPVRLDPPVPRSVG